MTECNTPPAHATATGPDMLAVRHWISGATELGKDESVPVKIHDLGGLKVTIVFPKVATVVRDEGSDGDGYNSKPAPPLEIPLAALALYLKRTRRKGASTRAQAIWEACIRDTLTDDGDVQLPAEALAALAKVQKSLPVPPPERKRTSATRGGCKGVVITVEPAPVG